MNTAFGTGVFTVSYDEGELKLSITAESQNELRLFTDDGLKGANDWTGPACNSSDLRSANELLGNYTALPMTAQAFKSGIVDLRRFHNVYMNSANLSSFKTLGHEANLIFSKNSNYDRLWFHNIDNIAVSHDLTDVSKLVLKTLKFRLSDAYGQTIDLRGVPISFSLVVLDQAD